MRVRRNLKLLVEPASVATGDIAFNLIVFFLVCASMQPDSGRKQTVPKAESTAEKAETVKNIEVTLTRQAVLVSGDAVNVRDLEARLRPMLANKSAEERVVIVKSRDDVEYAHWIDVTTRIEDAGGIITLQLEEEREVQVQ
jgi:biopolymer transport protein ExbD